MLQRTFDWYNFTKSPNVIFQVAVQKTYNKVVIEPNCMNVFVIDLYTTGQKF